MPFNSDVLDLIVVNGWELTLIHPLLGTNRTSFHFETLDGLQKMTNNVDIVSAGTNFKQKFGAQIVDYGDLSLTRTLQNNQNDKLLMDMVDSCIEDGFKFPEGTAIVSKLHWSKPLFKLSLKNFKFNGFTWPSFDINGEDKFIQTFQASVEGYTML